MRPNFIIAAATALYCILNPTGTLHAFKSGDVQLTPYGRIGESYDDNIAYSKEDRMNDFITELRAGIAAVYEGRKAEASLSADIAQNLFVKNPKYNNNSQYLHLHVDSYPDKVQRLNFTERFSHVYEPQSFNEAFGLTAGRYSYLRNYFGIGYSREISKQASFGLNCGNSVDLPSRDELDNSYSSAISSYISYAFSSQTSASAAYSFNTRWFEQGGNAYTHGFDLLLKQYATKQLYFDVSGGLDYINSYDSTTYLKPSYKLSVTDDIDETKKAVISFERQYDTNPYSKDVFKYWKISGEFIWQLARRIAAFGNVFFGQGRYVESSVKDSLQGGYFGVSYAITKHFKGVLSYRYAVSGSTLEQNEYIKNTIYLGVRAEF